MSPIDQRDRISTLLDSLNNVEFDYQLLAQILPAPPKLPLPTEPVFNSHELFTLTFGTKMENYRITANKYAQTDITELRELATLNSSLAEMKEKANTFAEDLDRVRKAMEQEQLVLVQQATLRVHMLARARLDQVANQYGIEVERVRAACRTQLANAISILQGLLMRARRREASDTEHQLHQQIIQLEGELQKKFLDIRLLRVQVEQLQEELSETQHIRSSSTVDIPKVQRFQKIETKESEVQCILLTKTTTTVTKPDTQNLKILEQQIDVLKKAFEASQHQVERLTERTGTLENEISSGSDRFQTLDTENAELKEKSISMEEEITNLKQQLQTSDLKLSEMKNSLNALRTEQEHEITQLLMEQDLKTKELTKLADALREQNSKLTRELAQVSKQLDEARVIIRQIQSGSDTKNAAMVREQTLCAEIGRLRQELTQLRQAADIRIRQLHQRLTAITEEGFLRRSQQQRVIQLHTAAVAYADEHPETQSILLPRIPNLNNTSQVNC
ncbi:hypothetical protein P879_03633 [Paragonimus westermani]|uniref:DUF4709 domain-containing protein n=1 Tax=Paragonimus westermani TaxID=34504 RepID=A0A8T0DNK9_9TREM|nr:hypothetical protein P879_03633 [Paragonimus westermani]